MPNKWPRGAGDSNGEWVIACVRGLREEEIPSVVGVMLSIVCDLFNACSEHKFSFNTM